MPNRYPEFLALLCCFLCSGLLWSQSCEYRLEMFDTFGDGWNGGTLTINLDTNATDYTLEDGEAMTVNFAVMDSQVMVLDYVQGIFAGEVSFNIVDADCNVIYTYGPFSNIAGDSIFVDTLTCPACVAPNMCEDLTARRLRSTSVDIVYSSVGPDTANNAPLYLVEFGPAGFTPGTGTFITTTDTIFRVQPLMEATAYDIYVSTICYMGQDTSGSVGPLSIFTPLTSDVAATELTDPVSGCALGAEEVRFGITNFGGEAKTLIPFGIAINGEELGLAFPNDGLYTGVVGVDSTEFTSFDLTPNFGAPGEYEIQVWTALDVDQNMSNDTLVSYLYSAPTEGVYPYFIDFEEEDGFWMDQERDETLSSWEYGEPTGELISTAAGGANAWVTNLDGFVQSGEISYLYSPCFDLSADDTDPVISFDFINALSGFNTNVILEVSTNGVDYSKVGEFGEGINWYNDSFNDWWDQEFGGAPAWRFTAIKVAGLAGEPSVRFRFQLSVNVFSTLVEGVGVDNFYLSPQTDAELAAISVRGPEGQACGSPQDFPTINFANLGAVDATEIMVSYQANGGDIVTEMFPDTLQPFEQASYTFLTPYDGSQADQNEIVAWVSLGGDGFEQNDTAKVSIESRRAIPFYEDFETGTVAIEDWQIEGGVFVGIDHGSETNVAFSNLYFFNPTMRFNSPNYGAVAAGDSLIFDYRFVDFATFGEDPALLNDGDSLTVDLIIDCDSIINSFVSITAGNHTPTTDLTRVAVELPEGIVGSGVQLVFNGFADGDNGSDFYLDLDNINLKRCAASLDVASEVINAQDSMDVGKITLTPNAGLAPYTYDWSNGATTASVNNLEPGAYSVTVTDVQGCSEVYDYVILVTSTEEIVEAALTDLNVFPNPTTGLLQFQVNLPGGAALRYDLFNQVGQHVLGQELGRQSRFNEQIDLGNQPAGIYFLRVSGAGSHRTVRVVKTR